MAENLYARGQRVLSKEGKDNFDRTFKPQDKKINEWVRAFKGKKDG